MINFIKAILLFILISCSLVIQAAQDESSRSPNGKHTFSNASSNLHNLQDVFTDLREKVLGVTITLEQENHELRKQLIIGPAPCLIIPKPSLHFLEYEKFMGTEIDFVRQVFAGLRKIVFEVIGGLEQENIELKKLLAHQREEQIREDRKLAESLALPRNSLTTHKHQELSQLDSDYAFALSLSEGSLSDGKYPGAYDIPQPKKYLSQADQDRYNAVVDASKKIRHDTNVHGMTTTFVRPFHQIVRDLERTYYDVIQHQPTLTIADMQNEIDRLMVRNPDIKALKEVIDVTMGKIRGYWAAPIDGETGLDIREVMSNTFTLARVYGDAALENLCLTLADNIQTNGGCHPGVTGRLSYMFFIFVSSALEQIQINK